MVVAQIHGILTRKSDPNWPAHGSAFFRQFHPHVATVNSTYFELPLPRIAAVRNPRRSRALVKEILETEGDMPAPAPISLVAHSNGGVLAMQVARALIAAGVPVRALVLIAPALRTRSASREIGAWLAQGMLDYALLVRPTRDRLIGAIGHSWRTKIVAWPWGALGHDGWDIEAVDHGSPNTPETLDLPDMGHSDPVAPWNRHWLFSEVIVPALGLAPWGDRRPKGGFEE